MFNVRFVQHDKLSQQTLDEIIKVKSFAWPYSYSDQCEWINKNLKSSDIHVMLFDEDKPIAYLNLVDIVIQFDSAKVSGYGIGNVCAIEKGKGWGKELIQEINQYLVQNKKVGLLFCKDKLVKFYTECEWRLIVNQYLNISNLNSQIYTFVYNNPSNFNKLKFEGDFF